MRLIGRREMVSFPELELYDLEAKIDTGAYGCAIHCKDITLVEEGGTTYLCFRLLDRHHPEYHQHTYRFQQYTQKNVKNSFGEMEERYVIKTLIRVGRKQIRTSISLSDRGNMRYPVLIGRRLLKGKFIVDVHQKYTGGIKLKKALQQLITPA